MDIENIIVKADQTPGQVSFYNFNELKDYMEKGLSVYKTTEYTIDNIDDAKKDLKELKAIKKRLSDKKKELESAYNMPIEEVSKQLNELINMVKEPMGIIDDFIKANEKKEKEQEIIKYAKEKASVLGEYAEHVINSKEFFNPKWLNKTYKEKQWKDDLEEIITDSVDALKTIEKTGGENKAALRGYYFDHLSLDGASEFINVISSDNDSVDIDEVEDEDAVVGYKVLKIYGTERQMRQLLTELELSDYEYEEVEDGMPKEMDEITMPDFDSFVAFDIEHTGTFGISKGDAESEIIEIGAVKVENGEIVNKFDMLANPNRKIVPRVSRLTKITDDMVKDQPPVSEVIQKFKEFVGDSVLVGHNIKSCDIPHIVRAAKRAGISFENSYLDTKILANKYKENRGWENVKLEYLSDYYDVEQEEAHRAWCDAEANAYVYLKLKNEK